MERITEVILEVLAEWDMDPYLINSGSCDEFAGEVIERMGGYSDELTDNASPDESWVGHYWIKYRGMCYDAECPEGVKNWKKLPIFISNPQVKE